MNLRLAIKSVVVFTMLFCFSSKAQNDNAKVDAKTNKLRFLFDENRQKLGAVSFSYQIPITTGNNFIGNGFEGDQGFAFRIKFYVYKQLFIGYNTGNSRFDVVDTSVLGNYTLSRVRENFLYIGYDFLPLPKVKLGINTSVSGTVRFINSVDNTPDNQDTGSLYSFGINLEYECINNINLFAEYAFRSTNTNIEVPDELRAVFETGTYNTINIGVRFTFGDSDIFGLFSGL